MSILDKVQKCTRQPVSYAIAMDMRFPIGRFERPDTISEADRDAAIEVIAACPAEMRAVAQGLTEEQLNTPYRPDGWTIRQVLHHVPESHMNCYVRFKLALTESNPTIKPYDEAAWAQLPDTIAGPVEPSLRLLESLHVRWAMVLRSLTFDQWQHTFHHPESGTQRLDTTVLLYAWHGKHHLAHIARLRERMGW